MSMVEEQVALRVRGRQETVVSMVHLMGMSLECRRCTGTQWLSASQGPSLGPSFPYYSLHVFAMDILNSTLSLIILPIDIGLWTDEGIIEYVVTDILL